VAGVEARRRRGQRESSVRRRLRGVGRGGNVMCKLFGARDG
jgi:hypothetical protein